MKIQIEPHTLQRAIERGASETEIRDTIETGVTILGKLSRMGKMKVYSFNNVRNDKYYEDKKIEVYFIIERNIIITVTVYVFYGKF